MVEVHFDLRIIRKSWITGSTMTVEAQVIGETIHIREELDRPASEDLTFYDEGHYRAKDQNAEHLESMAREIPLWKPGGDQEKFAQPLFDFPNALLPGSPEIRFAQIVVELAKLGHLEAYKYSTTQVSCAKQFEPLLLNKLTPVHKSGFNHTQVLDDEQDRELFKTYNSLNYEAVAEDLSAQKERSIWVNEMPWLTYPSFSIEEQKSDEPQFIALPPPADELFTRFPIATWEREGDLADFASGTNQSSILFELGNSLFVMDSMSSLQEHPRYMMVTRLEIDTEPEMLAQWLHSLTPRWTEVCRQYLISDNRDVDAFEFYAEDISEVVRDLKTSILSGFHSATRNFERKTSFDNLDSTAIKERFWVFSSKWVVLRPSVMWRLEVKESSFRALELAESKIRRVDLHDGSVRFGFIAQEPDPDNPEFDYWKVNADLSTELSRNYWGEAVHEDLKYGEILLFETLKLWPGLQYQIDGDLNAKELLAIVRSLTFGDWGENEFLLRENDDECPHCSSDLNDLAMNFNRPIALP